MATWFDQNFSLGVPLRDPVGVYGTAWYYYAVGRTSQYTSLIYARNAGTEITATGGQGGTPALYSSDTTAARVMYAGFAIRGTASSRILTDSGSVHLTCSVRCVGPNAERVRFYLYSCISQAYYDAQVDLYTSGGRFYAYVEWSQPAPSGFGMTTASTGYDTVDLGPAGTWKDDGIWHTLELSLLPGTVTTWTPGTFSGDNNYIGGTLAVSSDGSVILKVDGSAVVNQTNVPLILNFDGQGANETSPGSWTPSERGLSYYVNTLSMVEFDMVGGSVIYDSITIASYLESSESPSTSASASVSPSASLSVSPSGTPSPSVSESSSASASPPPVGWQWPDTNAHSLLAMQVIPTASGVDGGPITWGTNNIKIFYPNADEFGSVDVSEEVVVANYPHAFIYSGSVINFRVVYHLSTKGGGIDTDGWISVAVNGTEVYRLDGLRLVLPHSLLTPDGTFLYTSGTLSAECVNRLGYLLMWTPDATAYMVIHATDPDVGDLFAEYFSNGPIDYPGKPSRWTYTDGSQPAGYPKLVDIFDCDVVGNQLQTELTVADPTVNGGIAQWSIQLDSRPATPTVELSEFYVDVGMVFSADCHAWEPYWVVTQSGWQLIAPPAATVFQIQTPILTDFWEWPGGSASPSPSPSGSVTTSGGSVSASSTPSAEAEVSDVRLIRRMRQTPHLNDEQMNVYIHRLQLDLETGRGLTSGQGIDPQIMLQWSMDGGKTWSDEHWVSAGVQGAYRWRALWQRLGVSRDRVWRVVMSDPVPWHLLDAYAHVEKGAS